MKQKPLSRIILFGSLGLFLAMFLAQVDGVFRVLPTGGIGQIAYGAGSSSSSAQSSAKPAAVCGNRNVDAGEECDDGKEINGVGKCSNECKLRVCGDGEIATELKEECEPTKIDVQAIDPVTGATKTVKEFARPSCGTYCLPPECKETKSSTGALVTTCSGGCQWKFQDRCSAEVVPVSEELLKKIKAKAASSIGSFVSSQSILSGATKIGTQGAVDQSLCGNENVDQGEECDSGKGNSDATPNVCRTSCSFPVCGDGIVDGLFGESCDDGEKNSNIESGACRLTCSPAVCGDGAIDTGEQCGGEEGCNATCAFGDPSGSASNPASPCGNAIIDENEQCDDGNPIDGDGCSSVCGVEATTCGNGIIDVGEECDQGSENSDIEPGRCRTTCASPRCGDAILDNEEECDDGNDLSTDNCTVICELPVCGDGFLQEGEDCDLGQENKNETGTCSTLCKMIALDDGAKGDNTVIILVLIISSVLGTIAGITVGVRWMALR